MPDSPDAFADQDWMLLRCVPCASLFRVSAEDCGLVVHCPQCRAFLAVPTEWREGVQSAPPVPVATGEPARGTPVGSRPPQPPSLGPRKVRHVPVKADAPKNLAAKAAGQEFAPLRAPGEGFAIPPSRPKAEYEIPVLIVPNTNAVKSPPVHEIDDRPRLEHLERIATTGDPRFLPDPDAPKPVRQNASTGGRVRGRSIVSWDEDEEHPEETVRPGFLRRSLKIAGVAALALVIGALLVQLFLEMGNRGPETTAGASGDSGGPEGSLPHGDAAAREASNALFDKLQNGILPAARSFLEAPSTPERLAFVRDPERVRPLMEKHAKGRDPDGPYPYRELGDLSSIMAAGQFFIVPVILDDYSERKIALEEIDGRYLVDWESFVAYSDMSVGQFLGVQPREPLTFRLLASRGDYYNYGFTEKEYRCFFLLEPDTNQVLYGYVRRDTPEPGQRLYDDAVRQGNSPLFAILRLRLPLDAKAANQVLIEDYVQRGWVLKDDGDASDPEADTPKPALPPSDPIPSPPPASGSVSRKSPSPSP